MELDHLAPDLAVTREGYYRSNGQTPPEPEHEARSCAGCGASLEGRDARTRWCSDTCKKRHKRANGNSTPTAVNESLTAVSDQGSSHESLLDPADDGLAELVGAIAQTRSAHLVAVSFEYADGWCCTVGRTGE
jgi:hypothetical protein